MALGFRLYWRWRSRLGRPRADREIRGLIRQMNRANPLWGAPRIHGELRKLGIKVSQATVAKYMVRRVGTPSPTWRSFLRNQAAGIATIDMFTVPSADFRLLFVMLVLSHDRRKIVQFDVTQHPTAAWLSQQLTEAFPWETAPRQLLRDHDAAYAVHDSASEPWRWASLRLSPRLARLGRSRSLRPAVYTIVTNGWRA